MQWVPIPQWRHLPARNEVVHAFSSHERVRTIFDDLIQGVGLEVGIRRMAAWAARVGVIESQKLDRIEVEKNMPSSGSRRATPIGLYCRDLPTLREVSPV